MMVRQVETCKGTPYMGLHPVCTGERLMDCNSARVHCFSLSYRVDGEKSYRFASVMGEERNSIGYGVWCRVKHHSLLDLYLMKNNKKKCRRKLETCYSSTDAIQAPT